VTFKDIAAIATFIGFSMTLGFSKVKCLQLTG